MQSAVRFCSKIYDPLTAYYFNSRLHLGPKSPSTDRRKTLPNNGKFFSSFSFDKKTRNTGRAQREAAPSGAVSPTGETIYGVEIPLLAASRGPNAIALT